jgi:hypothetical protein
MSSSRTIGDEARAIDEILAKWRGAIAKARRTLAPDERVCLLREILRDATDELETLDTLRGPRFGGVIKR